jgi:hypothetical protein
VDVSGFDDSWEAAAVTQDTSPSTPTAGSSQRVKLGADFLAGLHAAEARHARELAAFFHSKNTTSSRPSEVRELFIHLSCFFLGGHVAGVEAEANQLLAQIVIIITNNTIVATSCSFNLTNRRLRGPITYAPPSIIIIIIIINPPSSLIIIVEYLNAPPFSHLDK